MPTWHRAASRRAAATPSRAGTLRSRIATVEGVILAGVDHVEAGHPEHHRRGQDQRRPGDFRAG